MIFPKIKQIVLILTIGIGLGILVPLLMQRLPIIDSVEQEVLAESSQNDNKEIETVQGRYYARVQEGNLSIVKGDSFSGQILMSGIDIKHWPDEMRALITRVEFHSLDEVQSFLDSMSEELWVE